MKLDAVVFFCLKESGKYGGEYREMRVHQIKFEENLNCNQLAFPAATLASGLMQPPIYLEVAQQQLCFYISGRCESNLEEVSPGRWYSIGQYIPEYFMPYSSIDTSSIKAQSRK